MCGLLGHDLLAGGQVVTGGVGGACDVDMRLRRGLRELQLDSPLGQDRMLGLQVMAASVGTP